MATSTVQPAAAAANTITHKEAAKFLLNYQVFSGSMPFDGATTIMNDLHGLTYVLSVAFNETSANEESDLARLNPALLADAFRSVRTLVALAAFFSEAR